MHDKLFLFIFIYNFRQIIDSNFFILTILGIQCCPLLYCRMYHDAVLVMLSLVQWYSERNIE